MCAILSLLILILFSRGHWSFFLQLHPFCGVVLLLLIRIFLWLLTDDTIHVRQAAVAYFHLVLALVVKGGDCGLVGSVY